MMKPRSYSFSFTNSFHYSSFLKTVILLSNICFLLNIANANDEFNPLIQLPTNELYRNVSCSKTVVLNMKDFGAKGDGFTDDTQILRDVWKIACSLKSPSKIILPNIYLIRQIDFRGPCLSKVTLKIDGTITAPGDPEAWRGLNEHKWLYFNGVKNLKVEGRGVIAGMGSKWWARSCKMNASNLCRHAPTAMTFHRCSNLKIRNVTLINSQQMHMAFINCNRVAASGVQILSPAYSPNTGGIHISASTRIELESPIINTGDDCISIVGASSKIRMKNVVCGQGHGISIGSLGKHNSSAAVHDITIDRAFFFSSQNGLRIKTLQGGRGFVRNVKFQNVWMHNVSNPIIIDQYYCDSPLPCANQTSAVSIDNISFRGIQGTSATEEAIVFKCSDSYPCTRLFLELIQLTTLSGEEAKSFCWEAYGTRKGVVYPTSCLSSGDIVIQHDIKSNSTYWRNDEYSLI